MWQCILSHFHSQQVQTDSLDSISEAISLSILCVPDSVLYRCNSFLRLHLITKARFFCDSQHWYCFRNSMNSILHSLISSPCTLKDQTYIYYLFSPIGARHNRDIIMVRGKEIVHVFFLLSLKVVMYWLTRSESIYVHFTCLLIKFTLLKAAYSVTMNIFRKKIFSF